MVQSNSSSALHGIYVVKDPPAILSVMLVGFVSVVFAIVLIIQFIFVGAVLLLVVSFGAFKRFAVLRDGVVLDMTNDTMSFPGGGVEANEVGDYLKSDFILQYFKRTTIALSGISQVEAEDIPTTKRDTKGNVSVTYTYYINFVGTFGASHVQFASEGKRDELYNVIRQSNKMGLPVFDSHR